MKDIYIKWLVLSDEHKLQRMVIFPTNYYMTSKWGMGLGYQPVKNTWEGHLKHNLGGGFKDFLFSPLFGQDFQVESKLTNISQVPWNHQPDNVFF